MAIYGGKKGGWKGMASSKDTTWAVKAKAVFICNACGLWHEVRYDPVAKRDLPPPACAKCGRMDFTHFHSKTEAKRWETLRLMERDGDISELETQVRIPLLTVHHRTGKPVEWGTFVADFRYLNRRGERILEEVKPRVGMTYESQLKIRCIEAMGIPVTLFTPAG